jgi:hypothetical protein
MADVVTFGIAALQQQQSGAAGHEFRRTALVADDMPLLVGEDRAVRRHRRPPSAERIGGRAGGDGKTLSGHLEDLGKALLQSRGPGIVAVAGARSRDSLRRSQRGFPAPRAPCCRS